MPRLSPRDSKSPSERSIVTCKLCSSPCCLPRHLGLFRASTRHSFCELASWLLTALTRVRTGSLPIDDPYWGFRKTGTCVLPTGSVISCLRKPARIVSKRVPFGEPFIRERTDATRWLTENAERESARRFFMRVPKIPMAATFCDNRHTFRRVARWLSRSRRDAGGRSETPRFATVPVSNGPKLSNSLVHRGPLVSRTFRQGALVVLPIR